MIEITTMSKDSKQLWGDFCIPMSKEVAQKLAMSLIRASEEIGSEDG